jgi:hypothetical protein
VDASASMGESMSESSDPGEAKTGTDMQPGWPCSPVRIRAGIVFVLLDSVCVIAGYGLAEVAYFRDRAPAHYWEHFLEFLLVAVVVTIICNRLFGLYGRMWRHAGADEARQLMLVHRRDPLRPDRVLADRPTTEDRVGPANRGGGGVHVLRRRDGPPPIPLDGCSPGSAARSVSACGWRSSAVATPGRPPSARCSAARAPDWSR